MAQPLKNLSVEEARSRMLADAALLGVESVAIGQALGRVLARAVDATRDQPSIISSCCLRLGHSGSPMACSRQ